MGDSADAYAKGFKRATLCVSCDTRGADSYGAAGSASASAVVAQPAAVIEMN
jgi:hypothetical protein